VSSRISNEDVVICAAVGSRLLRKCLSDDAGSAKIVAVRDETMSSFQLELSAISVRRVGSWSIRISGRAIQRMREQRNAKLPKETGGVLIGSIDVSRRIIYVTDGSGSPLDSEEYPMSYVRGIAALQQQVDHVLTATDGQLRYLGEWHSHPDGYSTNPSEDDKKLFDWLTQHLARDGMPPVMCIVGQKSQRWFVDQVA
jgi:integrative and conjugative element protein (TIGR02256 family)